MSRHRFGVLAVAAVLPFAVSACSSSGTSGTSGTLGASAPRTQVHSSTDTPTAAPTATDSATDSPTPTDSAADTSTTPAAVAATDDRSFCMAFTKASFDSLSASANASDELKTEVQQVRDTAPDAIKTSVNRILDTNIAVGTHQEAGQKMTDPDYKAALQSYHTWSSAHCLQG